MVVLSMEFWAYAVPGFSDPEGGEFRLLLDGTVLDDRTIGPLGDHGQGMHGTFVNIADLTPGTHTFEVEALRNYPSVPGQTPYQYLSMADVEGFVPEPGSLVLMGSRSGSGRHTAPQTVLRCVFLYQPELNAPAFLHAARRG